MLQSRTKIGTYDIRLVIEQNTPTAQANTNEPIDSWSVLTTVWAERMLKGGKESFEGDQQVATNVETFRIRYSSVVSGLNAMHRVYESGTTDEYYITLVEKQRREGWIKIQAEIKE
jgi:head-tail adaptor